MYYTLESFDDFLFSVETDIINFLFDHGLLDDFNKDVQKVCMYMMMQELSKRLRDPSLLLYYTGDIASNHELILYYPPDKLNKMFYRFVAAVDKTMGKIFCIGKNHTIPSRELLENLDGEIRDKIILLENRKPIDPKLVRDFLRKNDLSKFYKDISTKLY